MKLLNLNHLRNISNTPVKERPSLKNCNRHRNVLCRGATDDLQKRTYFHKKRLIPGFTNQYNVDQLDYREVHDNIDAAMARELQLIGYRRQKKIDLIQQTNPKWNDFYEGLGR